MTSPRSSDGARVGFHGTRNALAPPVAVCASWLSTVCRCCCTGALCMIFAFHASAPAQSAQYGAGRRAEDDGTHSFAVQSRSPPHPGYRRASMNDLGRSGTHIHKGASSQLEVFGNAVIKAQALMVVLRSSRHCTASPVRKKPFFIRKPRPRLRRTPVAGRDIGAAVAHSSLARRRSQLELQPRHGHTPDRQSAHRPGSQTSCRRR